MNLRPTKVRRVTRTARPCPTCGTRTGAASYRGPKARGAPSGQQLPIGRRYCPTCDKLLPREK